MCHIDGGWHLDSKVTENTLIKGYQRLVRCSVLSADIDCRPAFDQVAHTMTRVDKALDV